MPTTDGSTSPAAGWSLEGLDAQRPVTEARIIHDAGRCRSAAVDTPPWNARNSVTAAPRAVPPLPAGPGVSNPSVNQPWTGASRSRASAPPPRARHRRARLVAARSSHCLAPCSPGDGERAPERFRRHLALGRGRAPAAAVRLGHAASGPRSRPARSSAATERPAGAGPARPPVRLGAQGELGPGAPRWRGSRPVPSHQGHPLASRRALPAARPPPATATTAPAAGSTWSAARRRPARRRLPAPPRPAGVRARGEGRPRSARGPGVRVGERLARRAHAAPCARACSGDPPSHGGRGRARTGRPRA